jgi:hypothetical protein
MPGSNRRADKPIIKDADGAGPVDLERMVEVLRRLTAE